MSSPLLRLIGLSRSFGEIKALNQVSFDVEPGEFIALLGRNGAGKTTLIRVLSGRVRLDQGEIFWKGRKVTAKKWSETALGIVPPQTALYSMLTAGENLRTFGSLYGLRGRNLSLKIQWALQWTGLSDRANDQVQDYSEGMLRRLNLACGLLHSPELAILDEPTVGIDPQSRNRIWEMIAELRSQGTTILMATHHLDEAQRYCRNAVVMDLGRVIASGLIEHIISKAIGTGRQATIHLRSPTELPLSSYGFCVLDDSRVSYPLETVATDLGVAISKLNKLGVDFGDIHVESPSLERAFFHLTGSGLHDDYDAS